MAIDKQLKGIIGVHLTAAKLTGMNLIALTTSRSTKGPDIVVYSRETGKGKGIQVKCTDKKDFPICGAYIKDLEENLKKELVCDYVLVDISVQPARFFTIPREDMIDMIAANLRKWLSGPHRKSKSKEEIEASESKKQNCTIKIEKMKEQLSKYENKWDLILDEIK